MPNGNKYVITYGSRRSDTTPSHQAMMKGGDTQKAGPSLGARVCLAIAKAYLLIIDVTDISGSGDCRAIGSVSPQITIATTSSHVGCRFEPAGTTGVLPPTFASQCIRHLFQKKKRADRCVLMERKEKCVSVHHLDEEG